MFRKAANANWLQIYEFFLQYRKELMQNRHHGALTKPRRARRVRKGYAKNFLRTCTWRSLGGL